MGEEGLSLKRIAWIGIVFSVAACASGDPVPDPGPVAAAPPPRSVPVTPAPPPDQCGARELAWLVGKPKTEIPIPVQLTNRRVLCTTCPRTEEYMPRRLNIFFDQDTGVVKEVRCG